MEPVTVLLSLCAVAALGVWFGWRLTAMVLADGYGFRTSSGLPRDWAPPALPSTPYAVKPHR